MKNACERYGVTIRGNRLLAACVENDGVRLHITSLATDEDNFNGDTLESGQLFLGVDQSLAVTRKVAVRKNSNLEPITLVRFEVEQGLLEEPEKFYFEILPIGESDQRRLFLSIAYHKDRIDKMVSDFTARLRKPDGFKLDAVALADGYLHFCRLESGDLQILLDIVPGDAVVGFLYRQKLRAIDRLSFSAENTMSSSVARKLAAELKLVIAYHLGELFREGVTISPSRLILCGRYAGNEIVTDALRERFATEIARPRINEGYFQGHAASSHYDEAEQFLIPLGLAIP